MRISDWSSDVCSSDLPPQCASFERLEHRQKFARHRRRSALRLGDMHADFDPRRAQIVAPLAVQLEQKGHRTGADARTAHADVDLFVQQDRRLSTAEHKSELQSLMRIPYAVF